MSNHFTEEEKKLMREVTNQCMAEQYGTVVDADGTKALILSDNDPFHCKEMSKQDLLELLHNNVEFREKYKSGYYSYLRGKVVVKSKILWSRRYLRYLKIHKRGAAYKMTDGQYKAFQEKLVDYSEHKYFDDFYSAVNYFMKQRNVTQLMIAQDMNVSTPYISRIMNQKETLTINLVVCFCIVLKLSPYYSRKLLSLAGFNIEDNKKYALYLLILNEHYNESLQYCDEIIDILAEAHEKQEFRLVREEK